MNKNTTGVIQGNQNTTWLINKLKEADEQYPTLSRKEEQELIKQYKDDRDTLNHLLIMHNLRLVFNIAKKYKSKTNDFDGLVQSGFNGLAEAAKRFDITKNIKFVTYAFIWVRKYVLASFYEKNAEIDKVSISLSTMSNSNSKEGNSELEDFVTNYIDPSYHGIKDSNQTLSEIDQNALCAELLDSIDSDTSLSATDKEIFIDLFYSNESPRAIAERFGMQVCDVNQIKKKILKKFRDKLEADYNITEYSQI